VSYPAEAGCCRGIFKTVLVDADNVGSGSLSQASNELLKGTRASQTFQTRDAVHFEVTLVKLVDDGCKLCGAPEVYRGLGGAHRGNLNTGPSEGLDEIESHPACSS
jgi:hypothetical protein